MFNYLMFTLVMFMEDNYVEAYMYQRNIYRLYSNMMVNLMEQNDKSI
jgi:hypothetical protein